MKPRQILIVILTIVLSACNYMFWQGFPDRLAGYAPYRTHDILSFVSQGGDTVRYSVSCCSAGVTHHPPGCDCEGREVARLNLCLNYEPRDSAAVSDSDFALHITIPDRRYISLIAGFFESTSYSTHIDIKKISDLESCLTDTLRLERDGFYLVLVNGEGITEYSDDKGVWNAVE